MACTLGHTKVDKGKINNGPLFTAKCEGKKLNICLNLNKSDYSTE